MPYYLINSVLNETSAVFRITGPDANTYLQGQFTQDINKSIGAACYGLFLNQKGKVMADGQVLRLGTDEFCLASFSLAAPKLRERLEAYLIADEVNIEDETAAWARISLWGDAAALGLEKLIGQIPASGAWSDVRGMRVWCGRRSAAENFELLVPQAAATETVEALRGLGARAADANTAECERIISGIPAVPVDIGLNDLPNEGGLDDVAISYTKGCYLGQEVMARLKNLGQVRRRLHVVRGSGESPAPGAPLFQKDKKIGEVRSVARDGNAFVAMVMLSLVNLSESGGDLSLTPDGPAVITVTRRV